MGKLLSWDDKEVIENLVQDAFKSFISSQEKRAVYDLYIELRKSHPPDIARDMAIEEIRLLSEKI